MLYVLVRARAEEIEKEYSYINRDWDREMHAKTYTYLARAYTVWNKIIQFQMFTLFLLKCVRVCMYHSLNCVLQFHLCAEFLNFFLFYNYYLHPVSYTHLDVYKRQGTL